MFSYFCCRLFFSRMNIIVRGHKIDVSKQFLATSLAVCTIRHFSLLNVNFAGACGYDFVCDGRRLVRAYLRRRRGAT